MELKINVNRYTSKMYLHTKFHINQSIRVNSFLFMILPSFVETWIFFAQNRLIT